MTHQDRDQSINTIIEAVTAVRSDLTDGPELRLMAGAIFDQNLMASRLSRAMLHEARRPAFELHIATKHEQEAEWVESCRGPLGDYADSWLNRDWITWNEALDTVVVTLPSYRDAFQPYADDQCYNPDELKQAFAAAGVKVAP